MNPAPVQRPPGQADPEWDAAWSELRRLLVGPEQRAIGELDLKVNDRDSQVETVTAVLPAAVDRSAQRGPELRRSLQPMVKEVVHLTLKHDASILIDAVLPVIGTLIRKYIAQALQEFMDTVNLAQEQALSPRSLQWRMEAIRTGKPYAEIVLSRSLLYRVEQVFLIHRETGLLMRHSQKQAAVRDADMVSGMLTAIQDFVKDSFGAPEGETLDTIQVGGLKVWIEQGRYCTLAAVVRGAAPGRLKELLERTLVDIEERFEPAVEAYQGDPATLQDAGPMLDACLLGQGDPEPSPPGAWKKPAIAVAVVLLAFAGWRIWERWHWSGLVARLSAEPGYAVTEFRRGWWSHELELMRDPLARPFGEVAGEAGVNRERVTVSEEPYLSMRPKFVAVRGWDARRSALRAVNVEFAPDRAEINASQASALDSAATLVRDLDVAARAIPREYLIEVTGLADAAGRPERNQELARQRTDAVAAALISRGVDAARITRKTMAGGTTRGVRFDLLDKTGN